MPPRTSNASPMPFPFLPVVLESPKASTSHGSAASPEVSEPASRASAVRSKPRTSRRLAVVEAAQPPGMGGDGGCSLRVDVVRSIAPECLTLLGAIVR
ncbi:hypothetical protein PCO31010_02434 [Pandoraea commovens]|uniref:Uncharacterized protein n=2 Tax=Pandoraea commovens TaxID=2508289 RepID=A0A5E4V5D4_9BURK|nr:hypothetical protein PCO31010_02434 [Pandoraea commovens]